MADSPTFPGITTALVNGVTPVVMVDGHTGQATPVYNAYTATASPVTTQTGVTLITVPASPAVGKRTLVVRTTLDVVLTIAWTFLDTAANAYAVCSFTMIAGNGTPQGAFITNLGAVSTATAPTVTVGAYANLASHTAGGELIKYSATSPSVGTVTLDLIESV
jgi:hypothetical protein